jgi:AIG1 family
MHEHLIFIGNPGAGKSALLNGIVREAVFNSRLSTDGRGVGTIMDPYEHPATGVTYIDTPGLSDISRRNEAAHEIYRALTYRQGRYRLVFFATQESGRMRPEDLTVMKIVLDALPNRKHIHFGIVINKLTQTVINHWSSGQGLSLLRKYFHPGKEVYGDAHFFLYPRLPQLEDQTDALHEPVDGFIRFLSDIPMVVVTPPAPRAPAPAPRAPATALAAAPAPAVVQRLRIEEWDQTSQSYSDLMPAVVSAVATALGAAVSMGVCTIM